MPAGRPTLFGGLMVSTTIKIPPETLDMAKALNINVSDICRNALETVIEERQSKSVLMTAKERLLKKFQDITPQQAQQFRDHIFNVAPEYQKANTKSIINRLYRDYFIKTNERELIAYFNAVGLNDG